MPAPTMHCLPLSCHRNTPNNTIERFTASAERDTDGWLRFRYEARGDIDRIALPAPVAARHTDELWRHTCFEAFITAEDEPTYVECNFSPSGAWATYRFARYRTGMAALTPAEPPRITLRREQDHLVLDARFRLDEFAGQALRIGLTAVIEDKAGGISYWAPRHPRTGTQPRPDFHHRGGFILRLAAPRP